MINLAKNISDESISTVSEFDPSTGLRTFEGNKQAFRAYCKLFSEHNSAEIDNFSDEELREIWKSYRDDFDDRLFGRFPSDMRFAYWYCCEYGIMEEIKEPYRWYLNCEEYCKDYVDFYEEDQFYFNAI